MGNTKEISQCWPGLFFAAFCVWLRSTPPDCGHRLRRRTAKRVSHRAHRPITGNIPTVGESTVNSAKLVVDQINEAGGLEVAGEKYKVVLLIEDNEDKAEIASSKALKLFNQRDVVALVGPQASRNAIPASIVAEREQVPMISPWSTNPETTLNKEWVFRAIIIDPYQGQVLARFVREQLGAETAAVIFDVASVYNRDLADFFRSSFETLGGNIVAFESYTSDAPDISQQLSRVEESGASVLFLPNYALEVIEQARQARDAGINARLIGGDTWNTIPEFARHDLNGANFSTGWWLGTTDPNAQEFITSYREAFGKEPDDVAALTFDSFGLLFEAARNQGKVDSAAIREGLASIENYRGVTGSFQYDGFTGDPTKSIILMKIENGEFVFHSRVDP